MRIVNISLVIALLIASTVKPSRTLFDDFFVHNDDPRLITYAAFGTLGVCFGSYLTQKGLNRLCMSFDKKEVQTKWEAFSNISKDLLRRLPSIGLIAIGVGSITGSIYGIALSKAWLTNIDIKQYQLANQ